MDILIISPDMENQELFDEYKKQVYLRRKFYTYKNKKYKVILTEKMNEYIKDRNNINKKMSFIKYYAKNHVEYNEKMKNIYRDKTNYYAKREFKQLLNMCDQMIKKP